MSYVQKNPVAVRATLVKPENYQVEILGDRTIRSNSRAVFWINYSGNLAAACRWQLDGQEFSGHQLSSLELSIAKPGAHLLVVNVPDSNGNIYTASLNLLVLAELE